MEWSEELKKAARSLTYFAVFCAAAGYLKIDPSSAFFGVKLENFNQTIAYLCLLLVAIYWLFILVFRLWEEWLKISNEHQSVSNLFEENRQCIKKIERDASFIANRANVESLIETIKQYDMYDEKIAPEIQSSGISVRTNYRIQQQKLYAFVEDVSIASERLSDELNEALELIKRNRKILRARQAIMIRMSILEAGIPVLLFSLALSAVFFGNH